MSRPATTADCVVVGGGVIGCSIALELARRGLAVHVVDKGPGAGAGSTSSSSAIIRFHYSTRDAVAASWESMHLWADWREHLGSDDPHGLARFYRAGCLVIDPPTSPRRKRVLALFDEVGVPYEEWEAATIRERLPALDAGRYWPPKSPEDEEFWEDAWGELDAYFTPDAGFVDDPQLAAHNLMAAAVSQGAKFSFRTEATSILTDAGRVSGVSLADGGSISAPVVINAAGPHSAKVNELAGVLSDFKELTTRALRQEVHVLTAPRGFGLDDGGVVVNDSDLGTYFRPQPGGTLVVGGVEPECDPLVWVEDPDDYDPNASVGVWEAQVYRLARRLPELQATSAPVGLAALYDVTPDWVPIYDRTSLGGFYVAIGTSGNQFKNAPLVGRFLATLVEACEGGQDHDQQPVQVPCERTGQVVNLGHYSRLRELADTDANVLG